MSVPFKYFPPDLVGSPPPVVFRSDVAYVDIETYAGKYGDALDTRCNQIRLISVFVEDSPEVFVFDMMDKNGQTACPRWWSEVMSFLDSFHTICCHNAVFDLSSLIRFGMQYPKRCWDTMVASQVLTNGTLHTANLKDLLKRHLDIEVSKELQASDWGRKELLPEQIAYSAADVFYLPRLHRAIIERLEIRKLTPTYELEMGFLPALVQMNLNGVEVDKKQWLDRSEKVEAQLNAIRPKVLSHFPLPDPEPLKVVRIKKTGEPFAVDIKTNERITEENNVRGWNLASPLQVLKMFQAIEVDLPNTSYETLVEHQDEHDAVKLFLSFRDIEKEATTFGRDWLKYVYPNSRVYPSWRQMGAATGRMSCASPNLQQVPRGDCRKGIVASEDHTFVRADFSQIEARIAAKISGDPVLIELFQRGDDIHAYAAKAVLGKLTVTPEERQVGKSLVFGLLFSMSARSLRVYCRTNYGVNFSAQESEVFRDRFFRTFAGLARWHDRVRKDCNSAQEFRTLLGRRRLVVGGEYQNMLGLGLNTPVQGTAGDMLKIAVRELWERREEFSDAKMVMLVHDEIVYEVPEERAAKAAEWLRGVMIEAGGVILDPIPCDASVKIGRTWGG
jgi:DNA polymerase-1